jgi:hypothetical protein
MAEDRRGDPSDPFRIGDRGNLDDPAVDHREGHDCDRSATDADDGSGRAVHEGGLDERAREAAGLAGDCPCAAVDDRGGAVLCAEVGSQHDVGMEDRQESIEIAFVGRLEERVDDLALTGQVGVGHRNLGALDATARSARELSGRDRCTTDHRPDLVEGKLEHVVEHECETFGRGQAIEHHEQGQAVLVGQQGLVFGPEAPLPVTTGSGRWTPNASSRRRLRDLSMFRQMRATIVVSQPPRFSTSLVSARLARSQASWTASSASVSEPSIR